MYWTIFLYIDIDDADIEEKPTQMHLYLHYFAIFGVKDAREGELAVVINTFFVDVVLSEFVYE